MGARRFPRLDDDEQAFRLLWPGAVYRNGDLSSAVFSSSEPPSVFIRSRLPNQDGEQLHLCRFKHYGRGRISVGALRRARKPGEFDVVLDGHADHPHEALADAHAELRGPNRNAARKLRNALVQEGTIEKLPPERLRVANRR